MFPSKTITLTGVLERKLGYDENWDRYAILLSVQNEGKYEQVKVYLNETEFNPLFIGEKLEIIAQEGGTNSLWYVCSHVKVVE